MTSTRHGKDCAYRAVSDLPTDETCAEQARRRAARWHAWLKSPECTFQDRENFERWCSDATNAAAYVALCADLAVAPEFALEPPLETDFDYATHAFAPSVHLPRLQTERP